MAGAHSVGKEVREETVHQIEHVVLGRGFQGMQKGHQRRELPQLREALFRHEIKTTYVRMRDLERRG